MPDDNSVPVTLESLAAQIKAFSESMNRRFDALGDVNARFAAVDARFAAVDARFDAVEAKIDKSEAETRSQLGVKIEAVDAASNSCTTSSSPSRATTRQTRERTRNSRAVSRITT
jgi:hypothetical protein